jgi:ankyrin repeat protein
MLPAHTMTRAIARPCAALRAAVLLACALALIPAWPAHAADSTESWLQALRQRDLESLGRQLESGADPNLASSESKTALMFAAQAGDAALAGRLLKAGASIDAKNANGGTALMYAAMCPDPEVTRLLLQHGAQVNARARLGWTALLVASVKGNVATARALLDGGAEPNAPDAYGWTPLMRAVHTRHPNIVELLLSRPDTDIDARERDGATALHIAASLGEKEMVALLLDAGANPAILDAQHRSAADLALAASAGDVIGLLESGVDEGR